MPQAIPDPEEGEGRIGLIEIVTRAHGIPGANIERSAERFHLDLDETARNVARHTKPDPLL